MILEGRRRGEGMTEGTEGTERASTRRNGGTEETDSFATPVCDRTRLTAGGWGDRRSGTQPLNGSCSADAAALARRAIEGRPACTSCSASSFGSLCARVALRSHGPADGRAVIGRRPVSLARLSPFLRVSVFEARSVPSVPSVPPNPFHPRALGGAAGGVASSFRRVVR